MFRRASVLVVAAAFALGGCSRKAKDAPAEQPAAGPIAAASIGDAATPASAPADDAAPATAGPAAKGTDGAEAAWNAMAAGGAGSAAVSAAVPAGGKAPFLWKVEGGRAPLYLFGTIHVPDDRERATIRMPQQAPGQSRHEGRGCDLGTHPGTLVKVRELVEAGCPGTEACELEGDQSLDVCGIRDIVRGEVPVR